MSESFERRKGAKEYSDQVAALVSSVDALAVNAQGIRAEVESITTKADQDRRTLRFMRILLIGKMITIVLILVAVLSLRHEANQISDCTTPKGKCAQRSAAITSAVVQAISYRTEVERLQSEIQVAQAKGDTNAVEVRQQRLDQLQRLTDQANNVVNALQNHLPVPTTVTPDSKTH